jgi:hypothetical protein
MAQSGISAAKAADGTGPLRDAADDAEQQRRVLNLMLEAELDEAVAQARQQIKDDADAAVDDLMLLLTVVKEAPGIYDDVRQKMVAKLQSVLSEAEQAAREGNAWRLLVDRARFDGPFVLHVTSYVDEKGNKHRVDWVWEIPERENEDVHRLRLDDEKVRAEKVDFTLETSDGKRSWMTTEQALVKDGLQISVLPEMMPRPTTSLKVTETRDTSMSFKLGENSEISYAYTYEGILVHGTSEFVFTVSPEKLTDDERQVLVRLVNIRRYWNDELQETNVAMMPVKDRRGYKMYNAPPTWGESVHVGDSAWIDVTTLQRGRDIAGSVSETGKAEVIAVGVVATAVVASELAEKPDSTVSDVTGEAESQSDLAKTYLRRERASAIAVFSFRPGWEELFPLRMEIHIASALPIQRAEQEKS